MELDPVPARLPEGNVGAVLVALLETERGDETILVRRAENLKHHPGEMAFPGGRPEACDDGPAATALREAQEEIGLDPGLVRVLGCLPPVRTFTSNFLILPVVARLTATPALRRDPGEVAAILQTPLEELVWRLVCKRVGVGPLPVAAYCAGGEVIWGATYRILRQLLQWRGR